MKSSPAAPAWAEILNSPLLDQIGEFIHSVNAELATLLATSDPQLTLMTREILARPAKRLRPALAVLASLAAGGRPTTSLASAGASLEALHLASLLHDDVIDEADARGGRTSPNATWGNAAAVLLGDLFFSRSLRGAASLGRTCLDHFLAAADDLVGGDLGQTSARGRLPSTREYFRWLEAKTGSLFRLAVLSPALAGQSVEEPRRQSLLRFAGLFGLAYQLRDDLLDLSPGAHDSGKRAMNDCRRRVYTYPILVACARRPELFVRIAAPMPDDAGWSGALRDDLRSTGALAATQQVIGSLAAKATDCLHDLPPCAARQALIALAGWIGGK